MSTVNNSGNIDPNALPLDPKGSPVPVNTTSPTQSSYYASDIAPAQGTAATTAGAAANSGTPVLSNPDKNRVSISDYSRIMSEVVRKFTERTLQDTFNDIEISSAFYAKVQKDIIALKELIDWGNNIEQYNADLQVNYDVILKQLNEQVDKFNNAMNSPADQAALKAMNDAVAKYNEAQKVYDQAKADFATGKITQDDLNAAAYTLMAAQGEYNTAVTKYNNYGAQRNPSLPAIVDEHNNTSVAGYAELMGPLIAQIDQYNSMAEAAGLAPIPYPYQLNKLDAKTYLWQPLKPVTIPVIPPPVVTDPPTPPPPPPIMTTSLQSNATRPSPLPTSSPAAAVANIQAQNEAIQAMIDDAFDQLFIALKSLTVTQNINKASIEYYKDKAKINNNAAKPLVDEETVAVSASQILRAGTTKGTPSGLDFLNMFGKVIFPDLAAQIKNTQIPDKADKALELLTLSNVQFLISAGMFGGKTAVQLMGTNLRDMSIGGNASKIAMAFGFAKEVQKLANSDVYEKAAENIAKNSGTAMDAKPMENAVGDMKLTGALMALFQIARAVGTPELVKQVIVAAGGASIPELKALLDKPAAGTLVDTLSDPISKNSLKQTLSEELANVKGMPAADAQKVINQVVDNVSTKGSGLTEQNISQTLAAAFQKEGIDTKTATTLAGFAVNVLRDEHDRPELNLTFNKPALDKAILQDPFFTEPVISKAINLVLTQNNKIPSLREFRTELMHELQLTGMDRTTALSKGNEVLDILNEYSGAAIRGQAGTTLPPNADQAALSNTTSKAAIQTLRQELDVVPSHEISRDLVKALFGEDRSSVVNIISDSIKSAQKTGSKEENLKIADRVEVFLRPNVELYAFAQALLDPGTSILYSSATGVMYQGSEPSNYKKSIDVLI